MNLHEVLTRFEKVKLSGNKAQVLCPCHDDKEQSLSIKQAPDGRILLHCFAGCPTENILNRVGLTFADIGASGSERKPNDWRAYVERVTESQLVAHYNYTDIDGNYLFTRIRLFPKTFMYGFLERDPFGNERFTFSGKKRSSSGLCGIFTASVTAFKKAIQNGEMVYYVEGEKDVLSLESRGFHAVTCGAAKDWEIRCKGVSSLFDGADLVILGDNDQSGKDLVKAVARDLKSVCKSIVTVFPSKIEKGDITDFFENGGTESELLQMIADARQKGNQRTGSQALFSDFEALINDLSLTIRYNVISKHVEVQGLPSEYSTENATNILPGFIRDEAKKRGLKMSLPDIQDFIFRFQDKRRYNPVVDMLTDGEWDGVSRLGVLYDILGLSLDQQTERMYVKKWLWECVSIAHNEAGLYNADGALVLQGAEGIGKTSFFAKLGMGFFQPGASVDTTNRDSLLKATSSWIVELGELDSTLKKAQAALKSFIADPHDRIRAPYAREASWAPRRTCFCATVNPAEFLHDESGVRRFWVVHVESIDLDKLQGLSVEWVTQLWREVYQTLYLPSPQGWRLTQDQIKELKTRNQSAQIKLQCQDTIDERLNWDADISEWHWCTTSNVVDQLTLYNVADSKVGKALAAVAKRRSLEKRISRGIVQYRLPPPLTPDQMRNEQQ